MGGAGALIAYTGDSISRMQWSVNIIVPCARISAGNRRWYLEPVIIFTDSLHIRQNCVTSLPREAQAVFTANSVSREPRISSKSLGCEAVNSFPHEGEAPRHFDNSAQRGGREGGKGHNIIPLLNSFSALCEINRRSGSASIAREQL